MEEDIYPNDVLNTSLAMLMRAVKDYTMKIPEEPECKDGKKTLRWHKWKATHYHKDSARRWLMMEEGSTFQEYVESLIACLAMKSYKDMYFSLRGFIETQNISTENGITPAMVSSAIMADPHGFLKRMSSYGEDLGGSSEEEEAIEQWEKAV